MEEFINWAFFGRANLIKDIIKNKISDQNELFLQFTRHSPTMITQGQAGLNGSIKGIGFLPKKESIEDIYEILFDNLDKLTNNKKLKLLFNELYSKPERIDFTKLTTIELAKKHTYKNIMSGNRMATLLFFQPPVISYEVRSTVDIFTEGIVFKFVNLIHDFYHGYNERTRNPVYIMTINEIFNNSASKNGYGKKIY